MRPSAPNRDRVESETELRHKRKRAKAAGERRKRPDRGSIPLTQHNKVSVLRSKAQAGLDLLLISGRGSLLVSGIAFGFLSADRCGVQGAGATWMSRVAVFNASWPAPHKHATHLFSANCQSRPTTLH
eukprot:316481-Rhodomonas_salina.1